MAELWGDDDYIYGAYIRSKVQRARLIGCIVPALFGGIALAIVGGWFAVLIFALKP